jgi:hypothetical protein
MDAAVQAPTPLPRTLPVVRRAVRALLESSPAFRAMGQDNQGRLARAMVRVADTAASLIREEIHSDAEVHKSAGRPLATAQAAGDSFSGVAAAKVAGTTQAILNAVSFPRFVTELINGVFKAVVDTSMQQMNSYIELLNNVAASTDGFADSNLGPDRARQWLADKYPGSFEVQRDDSGDGGDSGDDGGPPQSVLQLRSGASMPSQEALKADLGLGPDESAPGGDPETLVPLARRQLAKTRQQMLATMVMLGMQRIVIDSGRINAAMRFHIDTRSAAQDDRGSTFDFRNTVSGSGSFGFGPWGVSAAVQNTIGYVSTQRTQTTEEMNTDLDLSSSVELNFKSDYLPLNRLASSEQVSRIRQNTRNPEEEEAKAAAEARAKREASAAQSDTARRASLDAALNPKSPAAPAPGSPGSPEAAAKAGSKANGKADTKAGTAAKPGSSASKQATNPAR